MSRPARPLRWELLPRVPRALVPLLGRAAAHLWPEQAALEAWRAFGGLLGEDPPRIDWGPVVAVAAGELPAQLGDGWGAVKVRRLDGRVLSIAVDGALAGRLAARLFGAPEVELYAPRRPTAAERGILAAVVSAVLAARGARSLVVDGVVDDPAALAPLFPDPWVVVVPGIATVGGHPGRVRVLLPESILLAPPPPLAVEPAALARLPVRLDVLGGAARLGAADAAALAPRDVVVLDRATVDARGHGVVALSAGRGALRARAEGAATLTVTEPYREGDPMAKAPDEAVLSGLPIELSCRLAELTLSAREVLELAPGAVVPLGRPLGSAVELVSGGRTLARGELVDVDGELGVRITDVLAR